MKPAYDADGIQLYQGDCREVLAELDADSVDACVTDPPYGLEFMGKEWDKLQAQGSWRGTKGLEKPMKWRGSDGRNVNRPAGYATVSQKAPNGYLAGKAAQEWHYTWATELLRILKPGGYLLSFGGTRTFHRLTCALEDAGFEIRDCLMWLYGTGFPKSLDVSKAIDKAAGAEREVVGIRTDGVGNTDASIHKREGFAVSRLTTYEETVPATDAARQWEGWGTALKPAWEPIIVARKPLDGTVAANVLQHGTGGLNIGACRLAGQRPIMEAWENDGNLCDSCAANAGRNAKPTVRARRGSTARRNAGLTTSERGVKPRRGTSKTDTGCSAGQSLAEPSADPEGDSNSSIVASGKTPMVQSPPEALSTTSTETSSTTDSKTCSLCGVPITSTSTRDRVAIGRWPPNVLLDSEAAALLDEQSGERVSAYPGRPDLAQAYAGREIQSSGASVFGDGIGNQAGLARSDSGGASRFFYTSKASTEERGEGTHPTVKPTDLMEWLVRLVTPPGGVVIDPFAGTGTTLIAARKLGFRAVGIELSEEYIQQAVTRLTVGDAGIRRLVKARRDGAEQGILI